MIRHSNNGRVYETTATPIQSEDYPDLVTMVTITEDGKLFDRYRTTKNVAEFYDYQRYLHEPPDDYEEIPD